MRLESKRGRQLSHPIGGREALLATCPLQPETPIQGCPPNQTGLLARHGARHGREWQFQPGFPDECTHGTHAHQSNMQEYGKTQQHSAKEALHFKL